MFGNYNTLGSARFVCHKTAMTIRLRAHHLLCMLTFAGKGYTPAFIANYKAVIRRLNAGEDIELVTGPDDICEPMLCEPECHCHNDSISQRDKLATDEISLMLSATDLGARTISLEEKDIFQLRAWFADGAIRSACGNCEWHQLCSEIAQNEFRGCHLWPPLQKTPAG